MSTLLEVSGVSVSFDGFRRSTTCRSRSARRELRAVIGPNGAGKTTFMDIITGKTKPDEGRVIWGDMSRSLLAMSEAQIARAGIGRKFQKPTVFEDQTVRDNLLMALKNTARPLRGAVLPARRRGSRPGRATSPSEIGLADALDAQGGRTEPRPEAMAGDRHAAGAGAAAVAGRRTRRRHDARPSANTRRDILVEAAKTRAVVVVEHDMEFVRRLNCKVTVLHEGSVLAEGSRSIM